MIFQNQGILPGIVMGTREPNERITPGERAFILASTKIALEDGDTPVKVRNFSKPKDKGGKS